MNFEESVREIRKWERKGKENHIWYAKFVASLNAIRHEFRARKTTTENTKDHKIVSLSRFILYMRMLLLRLYARRYRVVTFRICQHDSLNLILLLTNSHSLLLYSFSSIYPWEKMNVCVCDFFLFLQLNKQAGRLKSSFFHFFRHKKQQKKVFFFYFRK